MTAESKEAPVDEDLVKFMRKRSEVEPRYTAALKTYLDIHQKRRRAAAAKSSKKQKEHQVERERNDGNINGPEDSHGPRSIRSRSVRSTHSNDDQDPTDACCRRRRRRVRRRRRSCRRRRRRRSSRRRRRRSCSRRRRRRISRRRRYRRRRCPCS